MSFRRSVHVIFLIAPTIFSVADFFLGSRLLLFGFFGLLDFLGFGLLLFGQFLLDFLLLGCRVDGLGGTKNG